MPGTKVTQEEVSRILRDWDTIPVREAILVLVAGFLVILAIKWSFPRISKRLPGRFRLWVLPWEPVLRDGRLVGLISRHDIMRALDDHYLRVGNDPQASTR